MWNIYEVQIRFLTPSKTVLVCKTVYLDMLNNDEKIESCKIMCMMILIEFDFQS